MKFNQITLLRQRMVACMMISLLGISFSSVGQTSKLWERYRKDKNQNKPSILPDFSYAGYARSERPIPIVTGPIFNVTDYGALPNDGKEDYAGIQAAINAAQEKGGGVVFFPQGKFLINEKKPVPGDPVRPPITITGNNIVLRGSGTNQNGTLLYCRYNRTKGLAPNIYAAGGFGRRNFLTKVTQSAARGGYKLQVNSSVKLKAGDYIVLTLNDAKAFNADLIAPYQSSFNKFKNRMKWMESGKFINESHQIKSVNGKTITLAEPLRHTVDSKYNWEIRSRAYKEGFGLENMRLEGNSTPNFIHHNPAGGSNINPNTGLTEKDYHNGGFKAITVTNYVNAWVRNVTLKNWSNGVAINYSLNVTVEDVRLVGHPGHNSVQAFKSHNILFNRITDEAKFWHGPEVSHTSSGCVFRDCAWGSWSPLDTHSGYPYHNLLDHSKGGMRGTPGGGSMPHHGKDLVIWNFTEVDGKAYTHDFWYHKKKMLPPIVVGYQGASKFKEETLAYHESYQNEVNVTRLFDAQLERRLGTKPHWVNQFIEDDVYYINFAENNHLLGSWYGNGHNVQSIQGGGSSRQWQFRHLGNNVYSIQNIHTKRYLGIAAGACGNRTNVATFTGSPTQDKNLQWSAIRSGVNYDSFVFESVQCPGKALDKNGFANAKANTHLWTLNTNNRNQRWRLNNKVGQPIENGVYQIRFAENDHLLGSWYGISHNVQSIQGGGSSRQWRFRHLGNNVYSIQSMYTKRYLGIAAGACGNRTNVATFTGNPDQDKNLRWKARVVQPKGELMFESIQCLGSALDKNGLTNTKANTHLWSLSTNNRNQRWVLVKQGAQASNRSARINTEVAPSRPSFKIVPNPIVNQQLSLQGRFKLHTPYAIHNMQGVVVAKGTLLSKKILLPQLPSGMYLLRVGNGAEIIVKRFAVY